MGLLDWLFVFNYCVCYLCLLFIALLLVYLFPDLLIFGGCSDTVLFLLFVALLGSTFAFCCLICVWFTLLCILACLLWLLLFGIGLYFVLFCFGFE